MQARALEHGRLARRRRQQQPAPDLHARRQAAAFLNTPASVKKLFDKLGARFGQRNGGYDASVWRTDIRSTRGVSLLAVETSSTRSCRTRLCLM